MLLRMYLRWAESRGWKTELHRSQRRRSRRASSARRSASRAITPTAGCKTETGVHRLVRKSPFDSDNRRHTSFTSVFVSPEVDDDIDIEINPADLRTDVYRSSRRRRPARQQDRIGGAHHARADRHRRRLPDRAQPAQEPRPRDEDAEGQAVRAGSQEAQRREAMRWKRPSPTSAGATRSAPTCSTSRASRTCAPASSAATRRRCSMATSTSSSRPA